MSTAAANVTATITSGELVETGIVPDTQTGVEVVNAGLETPSGGGQAFTATVTTGTAGGSGSSPTAKNFLSRVVPWPVNGIGYINLHYSMINARGGKDIVTGKPYQDVDQLLSFSNWAGRTNTIKELWYCTSLQSQADKNSKGNPKAKRLKENAMLLKAIWIDVDVKDDPKHYKTITEAWDAICKFRADAGLPQFSAVVSSGGGLHIYWISKSPLTPDVWQHYADGLKALLLKHGVKCDAGLTTDSARILRIPGTLNHKYTPPRLVELLPLPERDYDFGLSLSFLKGVVPAPAPGLQISDSFDPAMFAGKIPIIALDGTNLSDGIKPRNVPLDPKPIFKKCRFLRDALFNGGKDYDNPLWNLSLLCATFMENGHELAHEMSKGHAQYTFEETQAKYQTKVAERQRSGLGYPSCATIRGNNCTACETCPLLKNGKSPLNIRPEITASTQPPSSGQANWRTGRSGLSFSNIPHRKWLYGFDLVRGELTVIGSPGGAGKSSLAVGMAICVATNRELLGEKIRGGSDLTALVINGEDSTAEIRRRSYAFCLALNVAEHDLPGLTVVGADDQWVRRISFLTTNEKGMSGLNQGGFDALQLALDALHPDVIVLDPLVSFCAGGNMNDNAAMALVMRRLKEIAAQYACAVLIVHHTRKGGDAGNVEAISGAAAISNLARRAIMPAPLNDDDIKRFGVLPSERFQYFKLVDAKSNLAPRAADSPLYRLHGVELPNPEPPLYPSGDNVQAITRVVLPIQTSGAANPDDMKIEGAIQALVARGKVIGGQPYPYSPSLAGANNERALLPDAMVAVENATAPRQWHSGDLKAVTNAAIKKMKADGRVVVHAMKDLMPDPGRFRKAGGLKAVPV